MKFNAHWELEGQHAFLSASNYHWINYDDEKLLTVHRNRREAMRGTELHDIAARLIRMGIKLPKTLTTLNMYVNDALGFRMTPEQILYVSDNAFGTADAISFKQNMLRIHDLKTGITRTSMHQLEIYAAYFCLEYRHNPKDISMELRIYKEDDKEIYIPDPDDIIMIMEKVIRFDKLINESRMEEL